MSEPSAESKSEGPAEGEAPSIFEMPGDWFLRNFVETVIASGAEVGLTLSIGGSIVSGIAINGEKYVDLFADQFTSGGPSNEFGQAVGEAFRGWKKVYQKPDNAPEDWERPHTNYIHLKNARYHTPGHDGIPGNGILWRGRLDRVDGFSLGNFQSAED